MILERKRTPIMLWDPPAMGVIGIDPGMSSGGISFVWGEGKGRAWPMPETQLEIFVLIENLRAWAHCCVLEEVHAMPKQGVSSTFKFGVNYGMLRMAITAAKVRCYHVTPVKWQNALRCRSKGNKNITKARAEELFPMIEQRITHRIADALLLAEYGRVTFLKEDQNERVNAGLSSAGSRERSVRRRGGQRGEVSQPRPRKDAPAPAPLVRVERPRGGGGRILQQGEEGPARQRRPD